MDVKAELTTIKEEALRLLEGAVNVDALSELETSYLGKKSKLSNVLKSLKSLSVEQKKDIGQFANKIKSELAAVIGEKRDTLSDSLTASGESFDVTLPGYAISRGAMHPVTQLMYQLNDAFASLGFEVYQGPHVSSELYAFDNLNFPPDHSARESMDTYWLDGYENKQAAERLCLRPHLTGGSVRYMQKRKPPFRFVYPGRVYRNESTDAGHERAFYQYEALMIDKDVPFSAGRLMVDTILRTVFGKEVKTRMRSGFFPFVEPGFEIDMECQVCAGKGCSVCGHTGWVEVMPGGPPHPNVMKAAGLDPLFWQGFYINIGLDRLVMMKHGINDIRLLHSGDLRFLKQFQ